VRIRLRVFISPGRIQYEIHAVTVASDPPFGFAVAVEILRPAPFLYPASCSKFFNAPEQVTQRVPGTTPHQEDR